MRHAVIVSALVVALAGCGGGGRTDDDASLDTADLPSLVLRPSDSPAGLHYSAAESKYLVSATRDDVEQFERLRSLGLRGQRYAVFVPVASGDRLALSAAYLFADVDGAAEALSYFEAVEKEELGSEHVSARSDEELGDEAWRLESPDGISYGIRVGNAVLLVLVSGAPDPAALAATVAERAAATR